MFFLNICNRSDNSAFRFSWAAPFLCVCLNCLQVECNFKIIVILVTSLLLLMLYTLKAVLQAGSVGNTATRNKQSFTPRLQVLYETEHPNRCVLFRGWLQPHLRQWCSLCSLGVIPLSSPLATYWFGWQSSSGALEFTSFGRNPNWELGSGCAPDAVRPLMVTWVHSSVFLQAAWNHLCVEDVWRIRLNLAFKFPDCIYCRRRGRTLTDSMDSLLSYWITCGHRHSFCCIRLHGKRLQLFFLWCNCKLGLD